MNRNEKALELAAISCKIDSYDEIIDVLQTQIGYFKRKKEELERMLQEKHSVLLQNDTITIEEKKLKEG